MGDGADDAIDRDLNIWLDAGCPGIPIYPAIPVKPGTKCTRVGCNGLFVVRTRKRDEHKFCGCSNFPKCKQTGSLLIDF